MHIAIDARELTGQATGAGRYLSQLLTHWNRSPVASRHRWRSGHAGNQYYNDEERRHIHPERFVARQLFNFGDGRAI